MGNRLGSTYHLKVTIVALLALGSGIALQLLSRHAASLSLTWLMFLPLSEVGGTLFAAGLFGIVWDYFDGKDKEARENERIRRLLRESAPWMRDAVLRGFALHPADLERVATPKLLDQLAENALALRLGDRQFASEIYADLRDQAIRASERWYDVDINVRLATAVVRDSEATPLFDVLVEWEYTTVPSHAVRRFACVSNRDHYYELTTDVPATSTWFMTPRPGLDASSKDAYELLYFSVDGVERPIRRTSHKSGQTYSVTIGDDLVRAAQPVRIKHIYRVRTPKNGHCLFVELPQPSRGVSLEMDYSNADVSRMVVTNLVSTSKRSQISHLPEKLSSKVVSVDVPGWLLPKTGFAFVWTLLSEQSHDGAEPTDDEPPEVAAAVR